MKIKGIAWAALFAGGLVAVVVVPTAHAQSTTINGGKDQAVTVDGDQSPTSAGRGVTFVAAPTVTEAEIDAWIQKSGKTATHKFIFIPPQVTDLKLRNVMRVGVFKALNHLCLGAKAVVIGDDVSEGRGLVFAVDPKLCFVSPYQRVSHWDDIAQANEKALETRNSPAARGYLKPFANENRVPAHHFVYNATHGGVYNQVMEWEPFEFQFNEKVGLNSAKKISGDIALKTYVKNAIVCGPRIITGHKMAFYGEETWFFRSHDEFIGRPGGDISPGYKSAAPTEANYRRRGSHVLQANPGDNDTAVASEWWFEMPNGFLAWGIHGEGGQERSGAESGFAVDPYNPELNLETGRCITCHSQGPKRAYDAEAVQGSAGWSSKSDLDKVFDAIYDRQKAAMIKLVTKLSDADKQTNDDMISGTIEPVLYTLRVYEDERQKAGDRLGGRINAVNSDARDSIGSCDNFCNGRSLANSFCSTAPGAGRFK